MPTRREIIARIETPLTALYGEREARQIARIIVMELGGLCLTDLVAEPDKELGINELDRIIGELAAGRPLQYVLGHTEFYGLDFQVREGVLIPRPETEELVRWIAESPAPDNPAVLDVGTGSGCIAVTLARLIPGARVTAVDISEKALSIARENARRLDAEVDFRQGDALGELFPGQREQFDLIVSNPPYIPRREKASMRVNVTGYEPAEALFVEDDDPLIFYRAIARNARRLLRPGGRLYFEIHENFADETLRMLTREGFPDTAVRRDLNDKNRMTCSLQKKIKRDKTPEQAYAALIRLCARSEKSSGDALRLMQRWGVEPSARQGVLQKLLADRFIDDNRYAEAFVRDKIRLSGWGARKIRTSLRLKGIAAAIIDEALARLDPANQSERLRTQLEKKLRLTRYKDTYDLKTKLIRYGLSLGYDYDAVLDAAGELIQTNDEPCDDF